MGRIIENIVVNHLDAKYFWRAGKEEIDVMLIKNNETLPIEVKYKNEIREKDLKTMQKTIGKSGVTRGIIVSKDLFDLRRKDKILIIPLWLFLLVEVT